MSSDCDDRAPTHAELLAENTKLRREIDHRVRNSLQVVASLIDVTARASVEPAALAALDILRARVSGMIAVYRTVNEAPHRAIVKMDETLRDLALHAVDSGVIGTPSNVQVLADGVVLLLDDAMPVALLVIEVLLSSGAGEPDAGPAVTVTLTREGANATLRIDLTRPDVHGQLPAVAEPARHMMEALARQLGGPLKIDDDDGDTRTVEVRFPVRRPPTEP